MGKPLYEILAEIMEEKDLSIAEIARLSQLPDSTVRGIVTRKQSSTALEVAFKLSRGLGVSLERLNGQEAPPLNLNEDASKKYEILLTLVDDLTDEEWDKLMDYAALLLTARKDHKDG